MTGNEVLEQLQKDPKYVPFVVSELLEKTEEYVLGLVKINHTPACLRTDSSEGVVFGLFMNGYTLEIMDLVRERFKF